MKSNLDDLVRRIVQAFPDPGEVNDELRLRIRRLLQRGFEDLELVTAEQFQSYVDSLHRAEARIEQLEGDLHALEEQLHSRDENSGKQGESSS